MTAPAEQMPGFERWRAALGSEVTIQVSGDDSVSVETLRIVEVDGPNVNGPFQSWSVLFTAPGPPFEQGTTLVEHPDLGAIPLLLSPIGFADGTATYETVISTPLSS